MARRKVYRVIFSSQGKVYEVYARNVSQGEIYGFVVVEGLLFGEKTTLLVDPSEEQLKNEFGGVTRFQLPYHAVHRIDEVEKEGRGKVLQIAPADAAPSVPGIPGPLKG